LFTVLRFLGTTDWLFGLAGTLSFLALLDIILVSNSLVERWHRKQHRTSREEQVENREDQASHYALVVQQFDKSTHVVSALHSTSIFQTTMDLSCFFLLFLALSAFAGISWIHDGWPFLLQGGAQIVGTSSLRLENKHKAASGGTAIEG
jgi:hypothetical protein